MTTESTTDKAEAVRRYFAGRSMLVPEHADPVQHETPASRGHPARAVQRERHFRYMLQDRKGATEIRITEDAMRGAPVEELGRLAVEGRQRKAQGEPGEVWIEMVDGQAALTFGG